MTLLEPTSPPEDDLDDQQSELLSALSALGGSAGNGSLRQLLGWPEDVYEAVKTPLVSSGFLVPGRGRGGSIAIAGLRIARKSKIEPRKMMEKAIEAMHRSVPEIRSDTKPSPKVGAVLVRPDGSIKETAARGELREGNHAEYTLLERKCIGEKIDDCVLFATLEPCLNRNHPKRGCARHIVNSRIKEVWVGIEDDNPAVSGKGIEYLKRHGVTVHMFDRDLQKVILKANEAFFEWARKPNAEPEPEQPIKLSKYEDTINSVIREDLSSDALELYRTRANISPAINTDSFDRLLQQQGLLIGDANEAKPSGFGLLLFGINPRNAMPQAGLLARAELADGNSSRMEFGQAMVLIPDQLEEWLNKVLPSTLDRSRMERRETVDLPFEMIREAVLNALIHRDYDLEKEKCQLVVNTDVITITSPGPPISPITLEQMNSFSAPMKSRNPVLHYVFSRMGMAEEQGYGLTSLKTEAQRIGLPLPTYSLEGDSLMLKIYRNKAAAISALDKDLVGSLSKAEQLGWEWLTTREEITSSEYAQAQGIPSRTAQNHLKRFTDLNLLKKIASGPTTSYQIIRS
jgi:ATP-dependent DNA helicase RecG